MEDTMGGIERLLVDPHIVRIKEAERWQYCEIDSGLFRKSYLLNSTLVALYEFLSARYICDDFTDHYHKRDDWRQEVYDEYGEEALEFVHRNALRTEYFATVFHITDVFNEKNYMGTNREIFSRLLSEMNSTYHDLNDNLGSVAPIDKVRILKQKAYAVLKFLSEQKPVE